VKLIAEFMPPDALRGSAEWLDEHAEALAHVPDDAVRIDTGRAEGGEYRRVLVSEKYADLFRREG
jgi:hypothetical protein